MNRPTNLTLAVVLFTSLFAISSVAEGERSTASARIRARGRRPLAQSGRST